MQTCPECGERNEDGELFCGSCGSYLEWQESHAPASGSSGAVTAGGTGAAGEPAPAAGEAAYPVPVAAAPAAGEVADPVAGAAGRAEPAASVEPDPAERAAPVGAGPAGRPAADRAEPVGAAGRAEADPAVAEPEADPAATEPPTTTPTTGGAGLGALGGRASRMVRRVADQATGGSVTQASSTASRAASTARAPRQAAGAGARRAVSRVAPGAAGAVAARATAGKVAPSSPPTRPPAEGPPEPAAGAPTTASRPAPAETSPAPAAGRSAPASAQPAPAPALAAPAEGSPAPTAAGSAPAPAQPAPAKPAPRQPAARRPGAPAPRRPVPAAAEEEPPPAPGDLVCGACGAGNAPHRNFCRRCGASLADAPVQPQRSWWRRLLRPDRKPGPSAGTRPRARRRRRFPTGLVVTLVVLGALAGAAWYFRDTISDGYDAVLDRVAGDDPVNPTDVTASSELAERPAGQARDGISDRSWAPQGAGPGEWIEFEFAEPYRLVTLLVSAGNGPDEEQRLLEARPATLRLTLTTTAGERIEDVELTDSGQPQEVPVAVSGVEAVRLTILSVYGEQLQAPAALAEVEFRGRG